MRAYDRVLLSGFYIVPLFHASDQWIAYSSKLGRPAELAALCGAAVRRDARHMVEEDAVTLVPDAEATSLDQLASFDLDTLVSGAVRLRADRVAIADSTTGDAVPLSFAEFDRRVSALAGFWLDLGLKPGERILVAGGAAATSVIALIAALRAGLDVALAPLHLSGEEMLDFACDTEAVALAADAAYGELAPAEELLSVAAQAPRVRLVCSLGRRARRWRRRCRSRKARGHGAPPAPPRGRARPVS